MILEIDTKNATGNKTVVCAVIASYISTFAGYPVSGRVYFMVVAYLIPSQLDSLKSRLQTSRNRVPIPRLAARVFQEEGIRGFYRGLWIPLFTISFVRAY